MKRYLTSAGEVMDGEEFSMISGGRKHERKTRKQQTEVEDMKVEGWERLYFVRGKGKDKMGIIEDNHFFSFSFFSGS